MKRKIIELDGVRIHYGGGMEKELHLPIGMNGKQLKKWLNKNRDEMDLITKTHKEAVADATA